MPLVLLPWSDRPSMRNEKLRLIDGWVGALFRKTSNNKKLKLVSGTTDTEGIPFQFIWILFLIMNFCLIPAVAADFVDSMDESNYIAVELAKPMGIVFEENDSEYGGIFVQSIKEDSNAAKNGVLKDGDQLVAVNKEKVNGMAFDDALGTIVDAEGETTKLLLFRGNAKQFYGPTGASQEWLDEFVSKGGVPAKSA